MMAQFSVALSLFVLVALVLVAIRARNANRALWAEFERSRSDHRAAQALGDKRFQQIYGRVLGLQSSSASPILLTAQHAEDVFLVDYFIGVTGGTFIEVGAYDGVRFSNTYALEQLGWKGLLVEAHPENAAKCRANRPGSTVEECAVVGPDSPGQASFTMVLGNGADLLSGLSLAPEHLRRCEREGSGLRTVEVSSMTLTAIMAKHGIQQVDFLSIDIEGGELEALLGLDLSLVRPLLILLEANTQAAKDSLTKHMLSNRYRFLAQFGVNLMFEDSVASPRPTGHFG